MTFGIKIEKAVKITNDFNTSFSIGNNGIKPMVGQFGLGGDYYDGSN